MQYETYSFTTYEQEKIDSPPSIIENNSAPPPLNDAAPSISRVTTVDSTATKLSVISNNQNGDNSPVSTDRGSLNGMTPTRSNSVTDRHIVYIPTKKLSKEVWIREVKIPMQRKCLQLLLQWIETYWNEDFSSNNELFQQLKDFTAEMKKKRDNAMESDPILDDEQKIEEYNKRRRKATEEMKEAESKYSTFLQEYIFKLENIVNTQQEWYKNVMIDLKSKQIEQQQLIQEQIKKSKQHHRNLKYPTDDGNGSGANSVRHSRNGSVRHSRRVSYTDNESHHDNAFKLDIEPRIENALDESNIIDRKRSYSNSMSDDEEKEENLANSLLFITVKNRVNAIEYAKQLTLLDWECFVHITPRQFLAKVMLKKEKEKWVQLKLFIDRFQQTHQYVIVSIIAAPNLTARVEMIDFFIFVAESLLKLNNLYSFMAVCTALDSINVQKLKIAWGFCSKSNLRKFNSFLAPLCSASSNYKKLRDYCSKIKPPGIPFLGIILKDITFANDGNRDRLSKTHDSQINFKKYQQLYRICRTIDHLQNGSYSKLDLHCKNIYDENDVRFLEKRASAIENTAITVPDAVAKTLSIDHCKEVLFSDSEYLSDDMDDNDYVDDHSHEHSKSHTKTREQSKSNFLSVTSATSTTPKQYGISNIDGHGFNLIPDYALQDAILKDFHSYILLNKSVIRAMTIDANRLDERSKDKYISQHYDGNDQSREPSISHSGDYNNVDDKNKTKKKKDKSIFKLFKRKSRSLNNKSPKIVGPITE